MALAFNGQDLNGFQIEKKKWANFFQFTPVLLKFEHKQIIANVPFDENHLTCFFYSSDNWDTENMTEYLVTILAQLWLDKV